MSVYDDTYCELQAPPLPVAGAGIWRQCAVAAAVSAYNILGESAGVTNHANRVLWAKWVLQNVLTAGCIFLYGIVQDAAVTATPTDAQVQAALDALVPTIVSSMVG